MSGAEGSHTILLLQPTSQATSRTYQDFETLELALDGVHAYEGAEDANLPAEHQDVSDLYGYLDQLTDVSASFSGADQRLFAPRQGMDQKAGAPSSPIDVAAAGPLPPPPPPPRCRRCRRRRRAPPPPPPPPPPLSHAPRARPRSVRAPQEADDVSVGRRCARRDELQVLRETRGAISKALHRNRKAQRQAEAALTAPGSTTCSGTLL